MLFLMSLHDMCEDFLTLLNNRIGPYNCRSSELKPLENQRSTHGDTHMHMETRRKRQRFGLGDPQAPRGVANKDRRLCVTNTVTTLSCDAFMLSCIHAVIVCHRRCHEVLLCDAVAPGRPAEEDMS